MYSKKTFDKVKAFIKENRYVSKTEIIFLGTRERKVNQGTLDRILEDMLLQQLIIIEKFKTSKKVHILVKWKGDKED